MLNSEILYNVIKTEMANNVTMEIIVDEKGNKQTVYPFRDGTPTMKYKNQDMTGFDVLIKAVTEKVIAHIEENITTSLKQRFDLLEIDYDSLATALALLTTPPLTAIGAAGVAGQINKTTRETLKTTSDAEDAVNKPRLHGVK